MNAFLRFLGTVSVGKASKMPTEVWERSEFASSWSGSGRRARRATAKLPWEGWPRMRAMPAPLWSWEMLVCREGEDGGGQSGSRDEEMMMLRVKTFQNFNRRHYGSGFQTLRHS